MGRQEDSGECSSSDSSLTKCNVDRLLRHLGVVQRSCSQERNAALVQQQQDAKADCQQQHATYWEAAWFR